MHPALLLLLGVMVGNLSGFFGVGGGFLITGGLLVFGVPPVFAVGTGLTLIMGSSLINTLKHRRVGNVDFKLGALMVIGTIPALFAAERLNSHLEEVGIAGPVIRYVYVAFLGTLGSFLLYDFLRTRHAAEEGDPTATSPPGRKGAEAARPAPLHRDSRPVQHTNIRLPVGARHGASLPVGAGAHRVRRRLSGGDCWARAGALS